MRQRDAYYLFFGSPLGSLIASDTVTSNKSLSCMEMRCLLHSRYFPRIWAV
jgi:hypothetical protein